MAYSRKTAAIFPSCSSVSVGATEESTSTSNCDGQGVMQQPIPEEPGDAVCISICIG